MADQKQIFSDPMAMVYQLAAKIIKMPVERRAESFLVIREVLIDASKEVNLDDTKTDEFVTHILKAIETLIREIEAARRAAGGVAA